MRLVVGLFDELAKVRFSTTRSTLDGVELALKVMTKLLPAPPVAVPMTIQLVPLWYSTLPPLTPVHLTLPDASAGAAGSDTVS